MRIPLLYRGEYSQWRERFMNYLEEQKDGEAMINSIQNGDQPLPVIAQVSLAGTAQNALNETAKDLWDALERQMHGSEYGEQDRKAAILYEYETFKSIEGEQLLDTYLRYLQVINDLKKCGYKKDNCELNYKFLNNLQPEWKQYGTLMRQTKNLMDINIDDLYNILKQNQGDKKTVVVTSDPLALVAEKTNVSKRKEKVVVSSDYEGSGEDDFSELKKITALLEGHFAKDCKKVKIKDYEYYKKKMLLAKKDKDEQVLLAEDQAWMESIKASSSSADEKISEISALFDNNKQHRKQIADQEVLFDKMSVELDKDVRDLKNTVLEKDFKICELEECVRNKDLEIEKCLERIGFENPSYFEKAKDLRPMLYDEKVIGLGYTLMFLTHFDEALEIEKFKRSRENKFEFAYDYRNLNASYVNEKINFEDDYFQEIINPYFEKIDSPFQQTSSLKPYVLNVILEKIIIDLEDKVVNLLEKEKANLEIIDSLKSKGFESSETVISESENQSENDCRVDEKECEKVENSKEKQVVYVCNDTMNVSCNPRMCDLLDDNNFFIFDDESVRISPVSKMPFSKKPCDSMNVRSKSNMIKSLPRTIIQICLWIIDSGCSKHMTGNRALLTNFTEKFLGTVRFGNNDFAVIAGDGDVVIGSMTIKKVYYIEGLRHNYLALDNFVTSASKSPFESLHALFEMKMV
nr:integrase, catalytic region, zinc finger, CCHC-type, peptidase aspartic, catalytic [Tanacetum cinerariifolium]